MFLHATCHNCQKKIPIQSNAHARTELEDERGAEFLVECKECGTKEKKHVNRINASPSPLPTIIALVISVIATLALWQILSGIAVVTFIIPLIVWVQQSKAANKFNSIRVPRNI